MLIKTLEVGYLQTNCYVITDEDTMDAAIIDPGADAGYILEYVRRNKMQVKGILLTHGHSDHCYALEEVHEELQVPVYMSEKDMNVDLGNPEEWQVDPPDDTVFVKEGDTVECGSLSFRVLECPGHTPGGLSFIIENCLFTGDTLFRLSCGRYDFPASSSIELMHSLEKLRDLPGDYEVYPGHESSSTLEFERRFNLCLIAPWQI